MMDEQTNRRIGSVISIANMIVSLIFGLIYTPLLIRYLGDSEYGVYTLAMSLVSYLSILDLGFGNALVRYTARARASGKEEKDLIGLFLMLYSAIALIAAIIGIFLSAGIDSFFASSFSTEEISNLKKVFNILLINTVIVFPASVFSSVIRSHERFIFANLYGLINNIVSHTVMILLLLSGFKSAALASVTLVLTVAETLINIYYCFRKLEIKISFNPFEKPFYKEIALYSAFIFINILVDQLYASTDKVILGKICGSVAVAVYGVGVAFQQYFVLFSTSISGVFLPHISKLSVEDNAIENMSSTFIQIGHIQLVLLSLLTVGFAVYGQTFIELWAGEGYRDAYFIALLILIPAMVPLSQNIGISILQAMNKHGIRSVMYLCIAVLNVAISIPLAFRFGGIGAAAGTAIGNLLGQILFMNWFYWKRIGINIPEYWKKFVALIIRLLPVAAVFCATLLIPADGWLGLIIKVGIGLVFAVPYYYLVVLDDYEKELILAFINKKRIT